MIHSNFQYIEELNEIFKKLKIKDNSLRYRIIFSETLIGAYQSRKQNPEAFSCKRQITGQILESEYIAMQRRNTLKLLKENSPLKVYEKLTRKMIKVLENGSVEKEGLYNYSEYFAKSAELKLLAGKRLETKLKNNKAIITDDMAEDEAKKIFFIERSKMKDGLIYEIKELNQKRTNFKYWDALDVI